MLELRIQPLRIPNGWLVKKNQIPELHPVFSNTLPESKSEVGLEHFEDNMFVAVNLYNGSLIEFGWYPPYSKSGNFKIMIVRPCKHLTDSSDVIHAEFDWSNAMVNFECKNRQEAIDHLESLFLEINAQGYGW